MRRPGAICQAVYFGAPVDQTVYEQVRPDLDKGLRALKQLVRFAPYIAGDTFTFADITAYFQLRFTNLHTTKHLRLGHHG